MKTILNLKHVKKLSNCDQKSILGGNLIKQPTCQGGGDPECCGTGPGQCGVGHCSGGILVNGVCQCF